MAPNIIMILNLDMEKNMVWEIGSKKVLEEEEKEKNMAVRKKENHQ